MASDWQMSLRNVTAKVSHLFGCTCAMGELPDSLQQRHLQPCLASVAPKIWTVRPFSVCAGPIRKILTTVAHLRGQRADHTTS